MIEENLHTQRKSQVNKVIKLLKISSAKPRENGSFSYLFMMCSFYEFKLKYEQIFHSKRISFLNCLHIQRT